MQNDDTIITTSFRISAGLKKRLKIAAANQDTDVTAVIRKAVTDWVEKAEFDIYKRDHTNGNSIKPKPKPRGNK